MPPARFSLRARLAVVGLSVWLLAACDQSSETLERSTPPSPAASPSPAVAAYKSRERITVHYHRRDNHYEGAEIWTWDAYQKHTPAQNELTSVRPGRFRCRSSNSTARITAGRTRSASSRASGGIGDQKDGGDKFWTPALGNEVWLVSGKNDVLTKRPDLSPKVESAWMDGPAAIVVSLTDHRRPRRGSASWISKIWRTPSSRRPPRMRPRRSS